jgi:hypothetical protein
MTCMGIADSGAVAPQSNPWAAATRRPAPPTPLTR